MKLPLEIYERIMWFLPAEDVIKGCDRTSENFLIKYLKQLKNELESNCRDNSALYWIRTFERQIQISENDTLENLSFVPANQDDTSYLTSLQEYHDPYVSPDMFIEQYEKALMVLKTYYFNDPNYDISNDNETL